MLSDAVNPQALRTVVLRHDTPDGGFHFDWMLERPAKCDGAPASLMTFRVSVRPDDAASVSFDAERLPDHRLHYLTYEGELTADRGRVARVAAGVVMFFGEPVADGADEMTFDCRFHGDVRACRWNASSLRSGNRWVFVRART